jgi:hypothetical protein
MDQNTRDILDALDFIKDNMATKDDVRDIVHDELRLLASKIDGIDHRLDDEALRNGDLRIPARVADLEHQVVGKSRAWQT